MLDPLFAPLAAFVVAAGLLTLTPGVDTAMVLRSASADGPAAGAAAGAGICAGLLLWGAGSALGLTALIAASDVAFITLKWVGAAYLLYLGVRLIARPRVALSDVESSSGGVGAAFRRGFLTNVLNPKIGVFYITFLPQFIPHGVNVTLFSLLLAGIHGVLTSLWFALLIALTVPLGAFLRRPSVVSALDRLTGCVFVAFGARLALSRA